MKENSKYKKILFIHYYFPPVGTVGSLRNYNIALELSPHFEEAHLMTIHNKPFRMEEEFKLDFLHLHEIKHLDYRILTERFSPQKDLNDRVNALRMKKPFGLTSKILDSHPGNLIWGEGGFLYIQNAYRRAKRLIREKGITHIYSSFRPMADHYIAYKLKKTFPHLIWMADFRDLPVDRNRKNVFFPDWQDKSYRKLLGKADFILTVSEGLSQRLLDYNREVLVLRNGLSQLFQPEDRTLEQKFTITYTGSLYPKLQDPSAFFAALRDLILEGIVAEKDLQLVYAGKDHRIWDGYVLKFGLNPISRVYSKLSLTESIRLQHRSHVNLLLSWVGPYSGGVVTGKLSEYLAAKRPVLGLINGGEDAELKDLIEKYNGGSVFHNRQQAILGRFIHSKYIGWKENGNDKFSSHGTHSLKDLEWGKQILPLITKIQREAR